jgi:enoyl-CoA hydratase/carnithine racemase
MDQLHLDVNRHVRVERYGAVAWLTLDRPDALNAFSKGLVSDFRAALAELRAEAPTRLSVLVITGAGEKSFCAGADLKERKAMTLDETRAFLRELNTLLDEVAAFPQPTIAALNGVAFGGGLELALACDIRLGGEGIQVGLPEVRLGILPGAGGTQRLSRACGIAVAKELILTGRRIDAFRARDIGLLSAVVPAALLRDEAERWATEIAEAGPLAVAQAKRAIDEGWGKPMDEALEVERAAYDIVLGSEDRNEGLRAFVEKRKPVFGGK